MVKNTNHRKILTRTPIIRIVLEKECITINRLNSKTNHNEQNTNGDGNDQKQTEHL